jgi:ribonuclease P protein component
MKNTIKNKREIDTLFTKGRNLIGKIVMIKFIDSDEPKYLVTAPIKNFKRAVDRNRIKRLLRESIKNTKLSKNIAIIYISKEIESLDDIKNDIDKLVKRIK